MKKVHSVVIQKQQLMASLAIATLALAALSASPFIASAQTMSINAVSSSLYRQLDLGMSGSDVSSLQTYLASDATLYPEGFVTGYFGVLTEAAVGRYQTRNGLESVGRVGPQTLAKLGASVTGGNSTSGTGGSDDFSAPSLSNINVRTSANSATFVWNTNEPALASVTYGGSWPFSFASAPVVQGTGGLSTYQTVTIYNLQPHTSYYYVLMSTDPAGNVNQTVGQQFVTSN